MGLTKTKNTLTSLCLLQDQLLIKKGMKKD